MKIFRELFGRQDRKDRDDRWIFSAMLIGGILSLLASFALSVEAVELAKNPHAVLSCSLSAVVNCATVGTHPTAQVLGFPNSFIGLISSGIVITLAVAGLSRVKFPRDFMLAAQLFFTAGLGFALWMFYQSFVVIQVLCPWCLLVFFSTWLIFFALTRYNIRENNLYLPNKMQKAFEQFVTKDYDKVLLIVTILLFVGMIIVKYGSSLFAY